jgi:hypothetical protein
VSVALYKSVSSSEEKIRRVGTFFAVINLLGANHATTFKMPDQFLR